MKHDHAKIIINKIKNYVQIPSVVGYEGPFVSFLDKEFTKK